jgi:hypothetical protein
MLTYKEEEEEEGREYMCVCVCVHVCVSWSPPSWWYPCRHPVAVCM